jgi:hypothetical protein
MIPMMMYACLQSKNDDIRTSKVGDAPPPTCLSFSTHAHKNASMAFLSTLQGMFFGQGETPLLRSIDERVAKVTMTSPTQSEGMQVCFHSSHQSDPDRADPLGRADP